VNALADAGSEIGCFGPASFSRWKRPILISSARRTVLLEINTVCWTQAFLTFVDQRSVGFMVDDKRPRKHEDFFGVLSSRWTTEGSLRSPATLSPIFNAKGAISAP
jgi:hypothetical protein